MHLIRLFMMAVDILEKGEINTCRRQELDLLRKIRSGGFQREDKTFTPEFYDILEAYEKRMEKLPGKAFFRIIRIWRRWRRLWSM